MQTNVAHITKDTVAKAVATRRRAVIANDRRVKAVNKAYDELNLSQWVFDGHHLVIASRTRKITYRLDSPHCTCESAQFGKPCWHAEAYIILSNAAQLAA